jgi:SAM-dependent methyltransferase
VSAEFGADWLALREPFDAAARSAALAHALVAQLPPRPRLLDLACGTGSLFRWLAPMIAGPQVWLLADNDPALLDAAYARSADWAERRGWTVTFPQRAMLVHTPTGAWRIEALALDITEPADIPFAEADAVLCSALLDLVSADWIAAFAELLDCPLLACLTVDGRDRFLPPHPADPILRAGFRRDQARDKGFGAALGPTAPAALLASLHANGFATRTAASDWRVRPSALAMQRTLIAERAETAGLMLPARRARIDAWAAARLRQALAMRLAIRIGHRDILALPGEENDT